MGFGIEMHVGHGLGLKHDLGLGVGPSYKPCWDHIKQPHQQSSCLVVNNVLPNLMKKISLLPLQVLQIKNNMGGLRLGSKDMRTTFKCSSLRLLGSKLEFLRC